jgi:carbamoyl-phosphate synthase large subunit
MTKSSVRVLLTGAGAPGIIGTLHSLKHNPEKREVFVLGTDIKSEVVGRHLCDDFVQIPPASDSQSYIESMVSIVKQKNIDIILPQNTGELVLLSENQSLFQSYGVNVIVSDEASIRVANNKLDLMQLFRSLDLPVGEFYYVRSEKELLEAMHKLGWPDKKVVVKLPDSNGQRGVRIITTAKKRLEEFRNRKPGDLTTSLQELLDYFSEEFPELIVTEYLSGPEYTVDVFRNSSKTQTCIIPRKRVEMRSGITFLSETEQHPQIIDYVEQVLEKLNLVYCFGFQFKTDDAGVPKLLESNPRVQGTMVHATLAGANVIYASLCDVLGESIPSLNVTWGHKLHRYWGAVGVTATGHDRI